MRDRDNAIPARDPSAAAARLEREIHNGAIVDDVDLDAAFGSWEYELLPLGERDRLRRRLHDLHEESI